MRIVAQNYKSGELSLLDVPVPACKAGGVLVRTEFSVISTGTEMMKVAESKLSLVGKARARPDQVKTVMRSLGQQGVMATYRKVMNRLDSYTPLGYSLSGVIVEVGAGVDGLAVGQRVACGGNLYALHAEFNWVPRNLCVAVPDGVKAEHAAYATVGSIAMQGFRQSEAKLGETACVIGLGLLGQLLIQMLRAAGVQVVGLDIVQERCDLARRLGAAGAGVPGTPSYGTLLDRIAELTRGAGCDHVFLASGGDSNAPVEIAAALARDRARIVDIGKTRLDLPWKDYYEKELDVRFSRSYGPGRYDPSYEENGVDYPIGYVRWTEQRNMACFIDLVASGDIDLDALTSAVFPFQDAVSVYERINGGAIRGLGILFGYEPDVPLDRRVERVVRPPQLMRSRTSSPIRIGAIGCGNYASSMLLPHLANRPDVELTEVATQSALSAANAAKKHGFARMSTDHASMLADPDIDAVMILTRHSSHAALTCAALRAGKAVFVEKPLALTQAQLAMIADTIAETGHDRLMVGYNRRFSPLLVGLRRAWGERVGPHNIHYRVNAGPVDRKSWYADSATEGSRFVGEGCHFVDAVSWWLGSDPVEVFAANAPDAPDNLSATLRYADGSVATLSYLTAGDTRYPKEMIEVFGQGATAKLDNFGRTEMWRGGKATTQRSATIDKGQKGEMEAFLEAVRTGGPMPIPLASLLATTHATLAAVRSAVERRPCPVISDLDELCSMAAAPAAEHGLVQ